MFRQEPGRRRFQRKKKIQSKSTIGIGTPTSQSNAALPMESLLFDNAATQREGARFPAGSWAALPFSALPPMCARS